MLLVDRRPFDLAQYHKVSNKEAAGDPSARGLVITLGVSFEDWRGGKSISADVFLDPGADRTMFSWRWLIEKAKANQDDRPEHDLGWRISERVSLVLGGRRLDVPEVEKTFGCLRGQGADCPPWLEDVRWRTCGLPGFEDALIGRDFLVHNRCFLGIDGRRSEFSLLLPDDEENQKRYKNVLLAFQGKLP